MAELDRKGKESFDTRSHVVNGYSMGDRNTTFFHSTTVIRRKRKRIDGAKGSTEGRGR